MNETKELVEFLTNLRFEDLPQNVVETTKLCILDTIGVGLKGSRREWSKIVSRFARRAACAPESSAWSRGWKTSAQYAALVNGTSVHSIEMDDRSATLDIHCAAAVVPAAIAAADKAHAGGRDVLVAVVAGYEIAYRLSKALRGLISQRFYDSPIKSTFGATVAAGKVLSLDERAMLNAVGVAGSMTPGVREWANDPVGTMVKRFHGGGWPAHNGVMAALLAQGGLTGPSTVLEGNNGVCYAFAGMNTPNIAALSRDLGKSYCITQHGIKLYCSYGRSHAAIGSAIEAKGKYGICPERIKRIEIGCSFKNYDLHTNKKPESCMAAQYSLPFITALAFYKDLSDPAVWNDATLRNSEVLALAERIDMTIDEELENMCKATNDSGGVRMTVWLDDGQVHKVSVRFARGTLENPATSEDVKRKFGVLTDGLLPKERAGEITSLIEGMDGLKSISRLSSLLRQPLRRS
ncbi:MAG: MmgE/PrpD family protein [Chloroflexi bacterium]|nr:MmgE/PrpD family protein [Chloroflexota bacterium]